MLLNSDEVMVIIRKMEKLIPDAKSELAYEEPYELLMAVLLSAQATDKQVNKVAPALFNAYPDAYRLAAAQPKDVEPFIQSLGLYRNKAKYMVAAAQKIVADFKGEVPRTREELVTLPGVGRKTANVVISILFDTPAIAVDTHVERVAKRLRIVSEDATPLQVEKELMRKIPESYWSKAHQLFVLFGRYYCTARSSKCQQWLDEIELDDE